MGWVEREYWGIIKRLMPGVRTLVGHESFLLLESGFKAECDAFRDLTVPMLRARLNLYFARAGDEGEVRSRRAGA